MIGRTLRHVGALALFMAPGLARAQGDRKCEQAGAVEVRKMSFSGNHAYSSAILADGIITEPSSLLHRFVPFLGTHHCLSQPDFEADVARLQYKYLLSGYPKVQIDTLRKVVSRAAVDITFRITEGPPTVIDSLRITGLDSVPERRTILSAQRLHTGDVFDRFKLKSLTDSMTRRLRDNGYPSAEVLTSSSVDTARRRATIEVAIAPGRRARLGAIAIEVAPRAGHPTQDIPDGTVRHLLGVKEGDLYRENMLQKAKLNLYLTDDYRAAAVEVDSTQIVPPGDSLVTVHVILTEGPMHSEHVSGGWGTLDCFRSDATYRDNNFASRARRLEIRARVSKIGIGSPLSGAEALCHQLRTDPYSAKLNGYLGFTIANPIGAFLGLRPSLTVFVERYSEYKAFIHTTMPGIALAGTRESGHRSQTLQYQIEHSKTEAQPVVFCALQNLCRPEDRELLSTYRRYATLTGSVEQHWSSYGENPSGGSGRVELRHASTVIGSDRQLQFTRATGEFSWSFPLTGNISLVPRLRAGRVVGPAFQGTSSFVPPLERLFAGGSSTVRGFNQNELGPRVYIAAGYDTVRAPGAAGPIDTAEAVVFRSKNGVAAQRTVPTGGNAVVVANLELRLPGLFSVMLKSRVQTALFVDAGELWTPGSAQTEDHFSGLKFTPGVGVRVATPIGLIRADFAYNPYNPRAGAAYFDTPIGAGAQLYCVSPGNTLRVTGLGAGRIPTQESGACVGDFVPPASSNFFRRLQVQLGIGQAF